MTRLPLATLLLAGTAGAALGQSFEGSTLSATISQRFEADTNYNLDDPSPGTSYFADTRIGLGFLNETDTQSFAFAFNTGARALWEAGQPFEFTLASPTGGALDYSNEWANGIFDVALDYRQRQVDYTQTFFEDNGDGTGNLDQLTNNAREMFYGANIGVEFGTATRSSYELRFIGAKYDYSETTPSQVARQTLEGQAAWTLQLNPVLASQVTGDYIDYSASNAADTALQRGAVGAGLIYTPDENLTLGAGVNYADRKREDTNTTTGVRSTTENNSGPGITGEFAYTTPDLVFNGNGEYSTAAPTGRFSGVVRAIYTLPRGQVTGRVFQNYTGTSGGGTEARVTGVAFGFVHNLDRVSAIRLDFGYATQVDVDEVDEDPAADINRANFTATYSHALTDVIDADIGYSFQSRTQDPTDAQSNSVFFQIGRTFETRP